MRLRRQIPHTKHLRKRSRWQSRSENTGEQQRSPSSIWQSRCMLPGTPSSTGKPESTGRMHCGDSAYQTRHDSARPRWAPKYHLGGTGPLSVLEERLVVTRLLLPLLLGSHLQLLFRQEGPRRVEQASGLCAHIPLGPSIRPGQRNVEGLPDRSRLREQDRKH